MEGVLFLGAVVYVVVAAFFFVGLCSSLIPVDPKRLVLPLRIIRLPFVGTQDRDSVGLATSVVSRPSSLIWYRLVLAAVALLMVAGMCQDILDPPWSAKLGMEPAVVGSFSLAALAVWVSFVTVSFWIARTRTNQS